MARSVNVDNGGQAFNIDLDPDGNLNFNANGFDGTGDRRMSVADDSGQLTVGGGGQFGALQLHSPTGGNTIFIGVDQPTNEARAFLGGGNSGLNGRVQLGNAAGTATIQLRGNTGQITCVDLNETSDLRLKEAIRPLSNALNQVMALRGVRYHWKRAESSDGQSDDDSSIGFIGQEVASVCPELVNVDAKGYLSLRYSRLTAVLVEAIKEQHELISQQASALAELLPRVARLEAGLDAQTS